MKPLSVLVRLLDLNWIKSSAEPLRSGPVESAPSSVSTCSFHWLPDPHRSSSSLQARQMSHPLGRRRATSLTLHSKEVWKRIECKGEKCQESVNARQASPLTGTLSGFIIMQLHRPLGQHRPSIHYFYRTQVYLGSDLWVSLTHYTFGANLTDVTLADEDTNSILTDNVNGQFQAMWQCM